MAVIDLTEKLSTYGLHSIRAYSEAPNYNRSNTAEQAFRFGVTIAVNNSILTIVKCIEGITHFAVYIDNVLETTLEYDYSEDWSFDLATLQDDAQKHTVSVKAIGEGISSQNLSNVVTAYLGLDTNVYGVSGMYSSATTLTRTDDAVGMSYTINSDGTINSDFDEKFPWLYTELVEDDYGNKFVSFPRMYFRVGIDSSKRITDIAVSSIPHYDGNTWYEVAPFWYGCYGAYLNGTKLESKSGKARKASTTRANFRTYAKNNGDGYYQLDLYHHTVLLFLWWIEWAKKDSSQVMTGVISGSGTTGGTGYKNTGGTDDLTTPSGYELTRRQMRYHYIEDFVGNYMEWVDGVYFYTYGSFNRDYATADPAKFADSTSGLNQLSYPCTTSSDMCVAAFGWDANNPFLCTPTYGVSNSSYNTYFCDRVYRYSGYPCLYVGACATNSGASYGVSYFNGSSTSGTNSNIGARLLKSP